MLFSSLSRSSYANREEVSISSEKVNCGGRVVVVVVVVGRRGRGFDVAGSGAGAGAVGLDLGGGLEDNKSMTSGIFFSV